MRGNTKWILNFVLFICKQEEFKSIKTQDTYALIGMFDCWLNMAFSAKILNYKVNQEERGSLRYSNNSK